MFLESYNLSLEINEHVFSIKSFNDKHKLTFKNWGNDINSHFTNEYKKSINQIIDDITNDNYVVLDIYPKNDGSMYIDPKIKDNMSNDCKVQ